MLKVVTVSTAQPQFEQAEVIRDQIPVSSTFNCPTSFMHDHLSSLKLSFIFKVESQIKDVSSSVEVKEKNYSFYKENKVIHVWAITYESNIDLVIFLILVFALKVYEF